MRFQQIAACLDLRGRLNGRGRCRLGAAPNDRLPVSALQYVADRFRPYADGLEVFLVPHARLRRRLPGAVGPLRPALRQADPARRSRQRLAARPRRNLRRMPLFAQRCEALGGAFSCFVHQSSCTRKTSGSTMPG